MTLTGRVIGAADVVSVRLSGTENFVTIVGVEVDIT